MHIINIKSTNEMFYILLMCSWLLYWRVEV